MKEEFLYTFCCRVVDNVPPVLNAVEVFVSKGNVAMSVVYTFLIDCIMELLPDT